MNLAATPAQRAAQLLAAMTTSDKLALFTGVDPHAALGVADGPLYVGYVPGNPALCIPALTLNDGPAGVADLQIGTTSFPAPIAQAATWDPALQRTLGRTLGLEAWNKGIDVLLGPDVNIARVPENGRNFEAFGEDPYLSGQTAAAEIQGIQENPVIATVKHFAVNSQETNRYYVSSNVDDRTLHEIYLPPFETAVRQGGVGAVMCAYGLVNGTFDCQNPALLTTVLRGQFGFRGLVMSDWGATWSTVQSANAGLDLEMPGGRFFGSALADAVSAGAVSMQTVDGMALDILTSMFRLGLFDHPPPALESVSSTDVSTAADQQVALRAAEEGTVLLRNEGGVLPLRPAPGSTIALIGAPAGFGDLRAYTSGGGSAFVASATPVAPLGAITARAARAGATVVSADGSDPAAAAALARTASVAVVFAYDQEHEGVDRTTLALPNGQDQLIEQVAAANPHTIVVLDTGGPVLMPWLDQVDGVVEAWYPGERDGDAIAAVLFGDVDPSGKLPQTFPVSDASVPAASTNQWPGSDAAQDASFSEALDVGYRWYDANHVAPLFPFGFGLSYTRFSYSRLRIARDRSRYSVSFTLRNTGSLPGADVPQLYVDDPRAAGEPPKQLEGYERVFLRPGRSTRVTFVLDGRSFAYWDTPTATWRIEPGLYRILVGASSRDIRLRGFVRR
ncbi:MAG: glycoside hydrolase family 3 C-terminal domain-containing protein [Acidobacteriota bacterium]|nr:glycoside hydrolase family 3 C-terminal domain-containing protein [Acidobacteriota bacterium]MDE3191668.1 glycoside hydrolase family 3 C-terminal domain-containing protein [Acidobacteriota bacterium]